MSKIIPFDYQESTNIEEHNQIVDKVNEIVDVVNDIDLDGIGPRLNADEANIAKNASDISQLKISDTEHTSQITTLDNAVDNHAREITALNTKTASLDSQITNVNNSIATINAKDNAQDAEIQGLSESVVSDLVASFDNASRKLSLTIERESAEPIDAIVTIPAGSTGGGSYSAGDGIAISGDNVISADVDGTTVKIQNGKLTSVGGKTYSAGNGISINNNVISQTTRNINNYVQKATTSDNGYCAFQFAENDNTNLGKIQSNFSPTERQTYIGVYNETGKTFHNLGIRTLPKIEAYAPNPAYDTASNDAIIPKAGLVANFAPISLKNDVATIQTNLSTLSTNVGKIGTSVNGCVNDISVSGNQMTVAKVNGQSNVITLPSGGSGTKVTIYTSQSNITSIDGFLQFCNQYGSISDNITLSFKTNDGEKISFNGYIQLVSEDIVLLNGTGFCWIAEASYGSLVIDSNNLYTLSFTRSVNTYTYKVSFFDIVADAFDDFTGNSMTVEDLRLWHYSNN